MNHNLEWIVFGVIVLVLMILDLGVFQKKDRPIGIKEASLKTVFFISIALLFNAFIFYKEGHQAGMQFLAGYLIELSLSVDNLFVFLMIFSYFKVPALSQNRVLFWGIIGALVFRAFFIFVGTSLLGKFHWLMYVFGAFLLFTAVKMYLQKEEEPDPEMNFFVKFIKKNFRVTKEYHDQKFFVKIDQALYLTPLFIVLLLIETTDVIFAFDSIPAIFAVTRDPFIVFTSNVFAILGLRSLYFCISGMMDKFIYLKPALCFILAFVGTKMLIQEFYKIPIEISLTFIVVSLTSAVLASIYKTKRDLSKNIK